MGVGDRLAGELAINVGVVDLADETLTFARLTECGMALRDRHGAEVVVLSYTVTAYAIPQFRK